MSNPAGIKNDEIAARVKSERQGLITHLNDWLEIRLLILGFVWLGLLIYELIGNLSPLLELIGTAIWIIFIIDFVIKFSLAAVKTDYLKSNWLTALSLRSRFY